MNDLDELIRKISERVYRCKIMKEDSRKEYDLGHISLSILNTRLSEYDQQIAEAKKEIRELEDEYKFCFYEKDTFSNGGQKQWDIFICHDQNSISEALEIFQNLTNAGFKVWWNLEIRYSDRWSEMVDDILSKVSRAVILLTPDAMSSRLIFDEWFHFFSRRKPIHCLLMKNCEIHHKLLPFKYFDWKTPACRDWTKLIRELQADFRFPEPTSTTPIVSAPSLKAEEEEARHYEKVFADFLIAARDPQRSIALTLDQVKALAEHKPVDIIEYSLGRIAEWSHTRYELDKRFVNLTLLLDKGEAEQMRWEKIEDTFYNNLFDVLAAVDSPAFVLLGPPGSGKSTLLRRFQMDHSRKLVQKNGDEITFFIQLNLYRGNQTPREWLNESWSALYPGLPSLESFLRNGKAILLLDALNEMPHRNSTEYHEKVLLWSNFSQIASSQGNRIIYSCRSLDYSAPLSSKELRVPQIQVQPMSADQMHEFLNLYLPEEHENVWKELKGSSQFDIFRIPYFLKLLTERVKTEHIVPKGRADLFTGFVRSAMRREIEGGNQLFNPNGLLTERDHLQINQSIWRDETDLPEDGLLIPKLSELAYMMQLNRHATDAGQVLVNHVEACHLLNIDKSREIIRAGVSLAVLDEERLLIKFFHQLLQEYFAARKLGQCPNPNLVLVEWRAGKTSPSIETELARISDNEPLPSLPSTGWEETSILAAAMTSDPNAYVRSLMETNLIVAANCAASPETRISEDLKNDVRLALVNRAKSPVSDLRSRITAGDSLGELGDPRFRSINSSAGTVYIPDFCLVKSGLYSLGDPGNWYDDEKPRDYFLDYDFKIGQFPVTNKEYQRFILAGGYDDPNWWDPIDNIRAPYAASAESSINLWKMNDKIFRRLSEKIDQWVELGLISPEKGSYWKKLSGNSDEFWDQKHIIDDIPHSETTLTRYTHPRFWYESAYNRPSHPVVGVSNREAMAYCRWLSSITGYTFRLPTETEWEIAAKTEHAYRYSFGHIFDPSKLNSLESHIRRTTPVEVYEPAESPQPFDMSGNVFEWTSSKYDFKSPETSEDVFVLKGGSWSFIGEVHARNAFRLGVFGINWGYAIGFRLVLQQ